MADMLCKKGRASAVLDTQCVCLQTSNEHIRTQYAHTDTDTNTYISKIRHGMILFFLSKLIVCPHHHRHGYYCSEAETTTLCSFAPRLLRSPSPHHLSDFQRSQERCRFDEGEGFCHWRPRRKLTGKSLYFRSNHRIFLSFISFLTSDSCASISFF